MMEENISAFFDGVMVMDENENIKTNRLALLGRISNLSGQIADLSKIVLGVMIYDLQGLKKSTVTQYQETEVLAGTVAAHPAAYFDGLVQILLFVAIDFADIDYVHEETSFCHGKHGYIMYYCLVGPKLEYIHGSIGILKFMTLYLLIINYFLKWDN